MQGKNTGDMPITVCGLSMNKSIAPLQYKCKVLHKSSLHENVVFSVCSHLVNAAYIIFIMCVPRISYSQYFATPFWSSCFPSFRKHAVLSQFRSARSRGSQPFLALLYACLLCELAVIVNKETHCFRVVSLLKKRWRTTIQL